MRPYVKRVVSSIKGGVDAELGPKTLIIGPNKIGKSAIVNAIEAAGSGRVSDVAGRAVLAKDSELVVLADESGSVRSTITFSDGTEATWELEKGHRAKRAGPEIMFPLREVREAILGSPETARKWILRQSEAVTWDEIVALVPESLRRRLAGVANGTNAKGEKAPQEALVFALEEVRSRERYATADAKGQRSVTAPPTPPPTDAELREVEAIIEVWRSQGARASAMATLDRIRAELATGRASLDSLVSKRALLESELGSLPPKAENFDDLDATMRAMEVLVRARANRCSICGQDTDPEFLEGRARRGREKMRLAREAEKRRDDLAFALREIGVDLASTEREVKRLEKVESDAAKDSSARETSLPSIDRGSAELKLRSLQTIRAGWEAARRAEEQALSLDREAHEWGQLGDALSTALKILVTKARDGFVSRIQKFLPREDLFGIDLLDGEKETFRLGLKKLKGDHMVLQSALSGVEWAEVTTALALATAGKSSSPCLVVPEDRFFDERNLTLALVAYQDGVDSLGEDAPQIVITSPIEPERIPRGWKVVRLGEAEKKHERKVVEEARVEAAAAGTPEKVRSIFD